MYYQPLEIDTGVGRYVYPLEPGGTDEVALEFWTEEKHVERSFGFHAEVKSAWPVDAVRLPGLEAAATVERKGEGHFDVLVEREGAELDQDVVLYYKLQQDLPGRIEVVP